MKLTIEHVGLYVGIVCAYTVYMICHLISGSIIPDGVVLSGIVGAGMYLAGYRSEQIKGIIKRHYDTEVDD